MFYFCVKCLYIISRILSIMAKANKSVFSTLTRNKDVTYPIGNGETLEITLNTLSLGDIVDIEEMSGSKEKFEIILRSLTGAIPDLTLDDVMNIPVGIVEELIDDICEFNGIDKPSVDGTDE